ncbi:hypothetical protein GWG65_34910 [Bradyrhizobium sp. CSA207]|uniref:hypothetical protein n=1 Tax=Bradyrhizobium sp. CSA207 TaxID=2698826 RepID=UPI0023B070A6|nr:hypothetical protein [Bradyrhizobium sp. CSA207]MDE5446464.1 hypothetical protein [Bradyrhizobium sp. CSA207]
MPHHVYWIRDASCIDPFLHGYIGVTDDATRRTRDHRRVTRLLRDDCVLEILHTAQTRAECLLIERDYRPNRFIGWNRQRGGGRLRGQLSRPGLQQPRINAAAITNEGPSSMHCLEHILFVTSIAIEKDEISKAELSRVIGGLLRASVGYVPDGDEPQEAVELNEQVSRRFEYLIHPGGIQEGEDN